MAYGVYRKARVSLQVLSQCLILTIIIYFINISEITLPDAVNFIMRLTNQELQTLGNNLRLDEARVKEIISPYYDLSEHHQRLMELWFRKESNPTWEKLHESMVFDGSYRRESSASTASVPTTPYSRKGETLW